MENNKSNSNLTNGESQINYTERVETKKKSNINKNGNQNNKSKNSEEISFKYISNLVKKDWKEIRGNKDLFLPMILMPIVFSIIMPLLTGIGAIVDPSSLNVTTSYQAIIIMNNLILKPMFPMVPMIVSMIIASDSFAGEKERKTAETMLVLPMTHMELFLGKLFTAFIPALIFEIISFFLTGIIVNLMLIGINIPAGAPPLIFGDLSYWLIAFLLSTLFSILSIQFGLIISARSKDMKSAQSISGIVIIPLLGLIFGSMFNSTFLSNIWIILILSAIIGVGCYIMNIIGSKFINRERLIADLG